MHKEVAMKEDLEALELYMQLEQLRIKLGFNYIIDIQDEINTNEIYIPPLILQPFVENSIWHGFNTKTEKGTITIRVSKRNQSLHIVVEDDGAETQRHSGRVINFSGSGKKTFTWNGSHKGATSVAQHWRIPDGRTCCTGLEEW